LFPIPMRPIISTCAGTDEAPANCASGTAAFALVPAGTRGLSVRVEVRPVGKSPYDGYRPVTVRVPLGDVGR
jgi:hypothetical protein